MKNQRLIDLVVVVALVAAGAMWFSRSRTEAPAPGPAAVESGVTTPPSKVPSGARPAPGFSLVNLSGTTVTYPGKQGPMLIMLSAVGCAGCKTRVPTDHKAVDWARGNGVPVWSLMVYGDEASARRFVQETGQEADEILPDPGGKVGVGLYQGNDDACWIFIDAKGDIRWQGGADPTRLSGLMEMQQHTYGP